MKLYYLFISIFCIKTFDLTSLFSIIFGCLLFQHIEYRLPELLTEYKTNKILLFSNKCISLKNQFINNHLFERSYNSIITFKYMIPLINFYCLIEYYYLILLNELLLMFSNLIMNMVTLLLSTSIHPVIKDDVIGQTLATGLSAWKAKGTSPQGLASPSFRDLATGLSGQAPTGLSAWKAKGTSPALEPLEPLEPSDIHDIDSDYDSFEDISDDKSINTGSNDILSRIKKQNLTTPHTSPQELSSPNFRALAGAFRALVLNKKHKDKLDTLELDELNNMNNQLSFLTTIFGKFVGKLEKAKIK